MTCGRTTRIIVVSFALAASAAWADTPARRAAPAGRVEIRGEWFYVDGEPFLVKGIGYSPYRPGQAPWKDTVDPAIMERDFQRIAEAGFNTIRTWSPLSHDALQLADRHGLMVLQGIWVNRDVDYASKSFQEHMLQIVRSQVKQDEGQPNILAFLVGNELWPESVYHAGVPQIETLFKSLAQAVKDSSPRRLVSYANWPALAFLNSSMWDLISFNLYPYEPSSVAHAFGYRSYIEHLRRTVAQGKPLIVTEVGLSVSPIGGNRPGYGGLTPEAQRAQLLTLWDDVFQAGSQGGVIFEWNDEWWKHSETPNDPDTHDRNDPEEWFGLIEFPAKDQPEGQPRPALGALATYNQAIFLSPVTGRRYQGWMPVSVYATERVGQIRVRLDQGKWYPATKLNRHWWKLQLPIDAKEKPGEHRLTMQVHDAGRRLLVQQERSISIGPPQPPAVLTIATDRPTYDVVKSMEPIHYTMTVTDTTGKPLADRPVFWSILEPQTKADLTLSKSTDAKGRIEGQYLVHDAGIVELAAATPRDPAVRQLRNGADVFLLVRQLPATPAHEPSLWERRLSGDLAEALRPSPPAFQLHDPGAERLINYARYGTFHNVGAPNYRYEITDPAGLAAAVGEGVYPNTEGLQNDPAFQAAKVSGKLEGSHWDFTYAENTQLSFFKWASTDEEAGVKQFYAALTLERAGLWLQAVKAYQAVLVHFPTSVGWTAFDPPTPWYVGKVARDKIEAILRLHPELHLRLVDARVVIENGFDNSVDNDVFHPYPGTLVSTSPDEVEPSPVDVSTLPIARQLGKGRVQLVQFGNGHWQLRVDGKPWVIRGLTYKPTGIGESPDQGSLLDWMTADRNHNGVLDVFETFVDANRNNRRDPDEPVVGDFALIRAMGVNALRLYHTDHDTAKAKVILRKLYDEYGLRVLMGDFVGMYTVGSGARWEDGTNYLDKTQRRRIFDGVKRMVREYKDEPYLVMWVLGNENNYGGVHGIVGGIGNAGKYPKEYYSFINELATWIHAEDPNHPVAIGNGDMLFLDLIAKQAPAIDVFGANAYRGWQGVGRSFFEEAKQRLDKPVLVTEYGCPAFQTGRTRAVAERDQAFYHFGNWVDLEDNMAGRGVGNAIGGVVFEWTDEWWKAGQPPRFSPTVQETQPNWAGPFPGGWNFEEWYGLTSQGDGSLSPFLRQLRPSYRMYQQLWTQPGGQTERNETHEP